MSDPITIDNAALKGAVQRLTAAAGNPDPVLRAIGEDLTVMVKRTFETSSSPDGTPWAKNSEVTLLALLSRGKGNYRPKDGKLSSKGAGRVMGKKPLIGETRALSGTIFYNVASGVLEQGTPMEYGAMQHFGGSKASYPNLWGDIPARPFEPITPDGELMPVAVEMIFDNIEGFLIANWRD